MRSVQCGEAEWNNRPTNRIGQHSRLHKNFSSLGAAGLALLRGADFLVGAEFTKVYAHAHGSAKDQDRVTPVQLTAAGAHKTVPAPAALTATPTAAPATTVLAWTARTSRELLPKIALLGGLVLLRLVVKSAAARERRLVRAAER